MNQYMLLQQRRPMAYWASKNSHTVKGNDSSSLCCIHVATEYLTYSGAPQYKTDVGMLEKVQWRATKIRDTWQETLKELFAQS